MKILKPCPTCGHVTTEWRHSLTAGLVGILRKFWDAGGGPVHFLKVLGDDYSSGSNLQKLRYWGFLVPAEQNKQTGFWIVTTYGEWFLTGKHKVAKHAWTRNGSVIRREAPFVSIHDIERCEPYWIKSGEWGERQRRLGKDHQLRMAI